MAYKTRIFIDFWNFTLNWKPRANGELIDWTKVPAVLVDEAEAKLGVAGISESLILEETLVYASCNPGTSLRVFLCIGGC